MRLGDYLIQVLLLSLEINVDHVLEITWKHNTATYSKVQEILPLRGSPHIVV
jgi:hypothetical protein